MEKGFGRVVVTAPGVWRIPHLAAFLPEATEVSFARLPGHCDALAGWANKPSSAGAQRIARRRGVPYIALEDGFLRSVSLGQAGAPPMSLVADATGIYYDERKPSDLEALLESDGWLTGELRAQAHEAIAFKNRNRLSKYNDAPALNLGIKTRKRVLVIDQTAGDASIPGAMADAISFGRMLLAAIDENPGADIMVKRHPAVAAGFRRGCVDIKSNEVRKLDEACDPIALLEQVDTVYTVSSLTGFEALLLGLPVRCFGLPFYAGWGATNDEMKSTRRLKHQTAEEIFTAAYMLYARYVDPLTGKACSIFDAMERLTFFKQRAAALRGPYACYGFAPWKHGPVRDVLGVAGAQVSFHSSAAAVNRAAKRAGGEIVLWASRETEAIRKQLSADDVPITRMEDGFIRSVGLGSDFYRANSFVLDDTGIYYDGNNPSRLEVILQETAFDDALINRAHALRKAIVREGISKYNLGCEAACQFAAAGSKQKVLVVGQVEDDASIRHGCEDIAANAALVATVRRKTPDAYILFKEHPDVTAGNRRGALSPDAAKLADKVIADADIVRCIEGADEIHTMTSLAGFEALLHGKRVFTYGRPFYAGWGTTEDHLAIPRRTRKLSLDELVAGALILYPLYVDPVTRLPCTPEFLLQRLAEAKNAAPPTLVAKSPVRSTLRYTRAVTESLRWRPQARI